ncbi:MAG: hypothetical protein ABI813_00770 [Bacteroidota bacterium]
MSKLRKLLLGLLSVLPLLLIGAYLVVFFSFFFTALRNQQQEAFESQVFLQHIGWIIGTALLMGITSLAMKIYFIIHAVNNKVLDSTERLVWILIFIFAGTVGYPVYWYMRIWKNLPGMQV